MDSEVVITVENLGKKYRLGAGRSSERYTALRDVIANSVSAPFRRLRNGRQRDNKTALRAVGPHEPEARQPDSPVVSGPSSGGLSSPDVGRIMRGEIWMIDLGLAAKV